MSSANDVLTTNNLILQADRAASNGGSDAGCLFDLAALIEAVVLHDHLLFLEAPDQFDFNSLPLGKILLEEGIIQSYQPPVSIMEIQETIYQLFGIPDAYDKVAASPFSARLGSSSLLPYYGYYDFFSPNRLKTVLAEIELARQLPSSENPASRTGESPRTLPHYCYSLIEMWAGNNAWARRPAQAFLVRTLVYWTISDRMRISFFPDFARLPVVTEIHNQLEKALRKRGYQAIANAFYTSIDELKRLNEPFEVPLPPFTMLVIQEATSPDDVSKNLLRVREEFAGLRKQIGEYEQAIRTATSLRELTEARRVLIESAEDITKKYSIQDRYRIRETNSYYLMSTHLGGNSRDLDSSSTNLFFKPLEWIKEWWLCRNFVHLVDIGGKLKHSREYNLAWNNLFRSSWSEKELAYYADTVKAMEV